MRDMEKVMRQLQKFLEAHGEEYGSQEELLQAFNKMMREGTLPDEEMTPEELAYAELEKLGTAKTQKEADRILDRALELDPHNLDAQIMKLDEDALDFLAELKQVLIKGEQHLLESGAVSPEDVGDYWLIFETRPYMRAKRLYAESLETSNLKRRAVEEYRDILRLNENDNLGVRYQLMSLYNELEEREKAEELYRQYPEESAFMLLPLILLALKADDELAARRYYKTLQTNNKNCRRVFGKRELDLETMMESAGAENYMLNSEEELYMAMVQNVDDFTEPADGYFYSWFKRNLVPAAPRKNQSPKKKK